MPKILKITVEKALPNSTTRGILFDHLPVKNKFAKLVTLSLMIFERKVGVKCFQSNFSLVNRYENEIY